MEKLFTGVYTAIVTPFNEDGSVDWKGFEELIERQITGGVAGIVPCGTTGESPTLSHKEHGEVIEKTVQVVGGRCQVVAGTGSNSTQEAIALTAHAQEVGADGSLQVNPYYNKPTQEGLFQHFTKIAEAVDIPIMLYNIKGRTGVNVETDTLLRILDLAPNIVSVKEASGDIQQIKDVVSKTDDSFSVLSGDDNITYNLIEAGGDGVVSVASNVYPEEIVELVQLALDGELEAAKEKNNQLMPFFEGLFLETNPIPVKAKLASMDLCKEVYRLPLCNMDSELRAKLLAI